MEMWWWHYRCSTVGDNPYLVASKKNRTLIFERHVVRCGFKNKHLKDMCLKESGLRAHKMITL